MQYQVRFRPMERLGRDGWERFDPAEQAVAIDRLGTGSRISADDTGKDGLAIAACQRV